MRLIAFLQAWDLLRRELGRSPTLEEYAQRFGLSDGDADSDFAGFELAFGTGDPSQVLDLLWGWYESGVKGSPKLPIGGG